MNIKNTHFWVLLMLIISSSASCDEQKVNVETVDFNHIPSIFTSNGDPYIVQGSIFPNGEGYINYNLSEFRFGDVTFGNPDLSELREEQEDLDEDALVKKLTELNSSANIAVILSPNNPQKAIGYCISLNSIDDGERLSTYIEKKYAKGKSFINPRNTANDELYEGVLIGKAAYIWTNSIEGKTLGLEKDYYYDEGEQALFVTLYLVLKDEPVLYGLSEKDYTYTTLLKEMWLWSGLEEMD